MYKINTFKYSNMIRIWHLYGFSTVKRTFVFQSRSISTDPVHSGSLSKNLAKVQKIYFLVFFIVQINFCKM